MIKHRMNLDPGPFAMIRSGQKTYELRLYDEKRQVINPGDLIEFSNRKSRQQLCTVEVKDLHVFSSFAELYDSIPLLYCGYTVENVMDASPADMDQYYSQEEQQKYGVVAIEIQLSEADCGERVAASKLLSRVLRHRPDLIGITVDRHGWARVDELIPGMRRKIPGFSMEKLEEIVRLDDKDRYSFNENRTLVRANQGHTIPVDVELEELPPPAVLYHGTCEKNVPGILQGGLQPMKRLYVHLTPSYEAAVVSGGRRGRPVVFQLDTAGMAAAGIRFWKAVNNVWHCKYVPPGYLTRVNHTVRRDSPSPDSKT